MLMYTQTSLRRLNRSHEVDLDSLRRSLELVVRQAQKQAKLIDQVLDAARLASGQLLLAPVPCELSVLIRDVTEQMRVLAPNHTVVVHSSGEAEVVVDPLRIEQVLINLLDNARKYSPPGTRIEVELSSEPEVITLAVRDHGIGIPAEEQGRIFERFLRLRHDQHGVGLGLHISREIIRMHGGELRVETPADGGTRFIARLPRSRAAKNPERPTTRY
jgi:signal transduction histidine kinase